jgi:hypothetical protein
MMNERYYFSQDGSYGLWEDGGMIVDTNQWTMSDWSEIENCTDNERTFVARGIVEKYLKSMGGAL